MSHLFIIIIVWKHCSHRGQLEWSPGLCTYSSEEWSGSKREERCKELNDDDEVNHSTNYHDDNDDDDIDMKKMMMLI